MPVRLIEASLPDFGIPATRPELSRRIYTDRLDALYKARRAAGLDALLIYADREHAANLAWLTGFDPRFEEALLVLPAGETPTLLAGPENLGRAGAATIEVQARLYPPFGLMGQDRSQTPDLEEVFTSAGISRGQRVGVLGWKYYGTYESSRPDTWFETPSFIVDTLRHIVGNDGKVVNANALLMDPSSGLRAVNEIDQIAQLVHRKHLQFSGEQTKRIALSRRDIGFVRLGEEVKHDRQIAASIKNDRTIAAGLAAALARDALLDQSATEIGVDQAPLCIISRFPAGFVAQPLLARRAGDAAVLEYVHQLGPRGASPACF